MFDYGTVSKEWMVFGMKRTLSYFLLIMILYLFVFQFGLMQLSSVFNYWDELYAVLAIPLFFVKNGNKSIRKINIKKIVILLILYIAVGVTLNIIFRLQVATAVLTDILFQLKFFLGIATTYFLFRRGNVFRFKKQIKWHAQILLAVLFLLVVTNKVFNYFPNADSRFGLSSEVLFFGHPTGLASVSFFLILMIMLFYKDTKTDRFFVVIGVLTVLSTLRFKAIAAIMLFCYMYYIMVVRKKRLTARILLPFLPAAVAVGGDEFFSYFMSDNAMDYARGALLYTSLKIMIDYFPFGTGLGTFASDPSGIYYSPVYTMYGIQNVWGLGEDWSALVSDTFWPMIIGQTGFIGFVLYILIIIQLFKLISPAKRFHNGIYVAAIGALVYLLISSVAESAFVNPLALPLSFIIGLVLCWIKAEREDTVKL